MRREALSSLDSPNLSVKPSDRMIALRPARYWKALHQGVLRSDEPAASSDVARLSRQVQHLQLRLRHAHLEIVMALVTAAEAKDPYSEQHSYHVAAYAERLGRLVNVPPADVEILVIASLLHDVGKIGIPDAILTKPGPLTVDEFEVVKQHPIVGEAILKPIGFLERELTLVRHHHEWYDGSGYPDGLAGDQIPLGARILQVADSIDAMVSPRSYKSSRCAEEVIPELIRCRGTQFDPVIADVAIEWLRSCPHEVLSPTSVPRELLSHIAS